MSRARIRFAALAPVVLAAVVAPAALGAGGVTIFTDDFESYADTAAMTAVWAGGPGTLDTSLAGANTKSMTHPGGTVNSHAVNAGGIIPSNSTPILWQFDFYWDGTGNKRISGGLRGSAGNGILEMGYYNAAANPATPGFNASGFAYRNVLMPGATNWVMFMKPDNSAPVAPTANTWNTFQAVVLGTRILFKVDLGRDGTWDSVATVGAVSDGSNPAGTAVVYNDARFGGPSGLSSGGGGADFDNLAIRTFLMGDANGDGVLNADDFVLIDRGFARQPASPLWADGDFNSDGHVDAADYLLIDSAYLQLHPPAAGPLLADRDARFGDAYVADLVASVPEPASLLAVCGVALPLVGRRRDRRAL